jgi:hypothetical protein
MKEVERKKIKEMGTEAIYLSDGTINLGLVKNSPVADPGLQVLGFQVPSVQEIEERLKKPLALTYKNEPPLELKRSGSESPYTTVHLLDPDGTYIAISEEGWEV